MGPFELMDLVGIDVGFEISKSFFEQSYGEPRWRPSPLAERMAAAGRHGRKTGRGWYEYPEDGPHRPRTPTPPEPGGGQGGVTGGSGPLAAELCRAAEAAGFYVAPGAAETPAIEMPGAAWCCAPRSRSPRSIPRRGVGFYAAPPLGDARRAHEHRGDPRRLSRPPSASSPRSGATSSGSATRRASCWPDRLPARQRGVLLARRGRRLGRGHRRGHDARAQPPARPARVGRHDRRRERARRARRATARVPRGALPARPRAGRAPYAARIHSAFPVFTPRMPHFLRDVRACREDRYGNSGRTPAGDDRHRHHCLAGRCASGFGRHQGRLPATDRPPGRRLRRRREGRSAQLAGQRQGRATRRARSPSASAPSRSARARSARSWSRARRRAGWPPR